MLYRTATLYAGIDNMGGSGYGEYHIDILTKLWRRGLFGGKYQPIEQILSHTPREHHADARNALDDLHQDGLIQYHKNRKCASINPRHKDDVRELLKGKVPDYILNLH